MTQVEKRELEIRINLDLKEGYFTVYESTIKAKSFDEARRMLDQAEKLMTITQNEQARDDQAMGGGA